MTPRFLLLTACTMVAVACAASERGFEQTADTPPATNAPGFSADAGQCTCSSGGKAVACEGQELRACPEGQRCFAGGCIEDACEAAKEKQSAEGCSFYTVVPDAYEGKQGCYAVFLTNTSPRPVDVKLRSEGLEVAGSDFVYLPKGSGNDIEYEPLPNGQIPENGLAIAFIAGPTSANGDYKSCPAQPAMKHARSQPQDFAPSSPWTGYVPSILLETSEPVVASDIYPYGGADSYVTGATILLPVNAWGKSYVSVTPPGTNFVDLIATDDDTEITLAPKTRPLGGADLVMPTEVGKTSSLWLTRDKAYHLVRIEDLTGLVLSGNKPFLVISGSRCWGAPCDAAHQQLPTVSTLGWEYAAVGHRDRLAPAPEDDSVGQCLNVPYTATCQCRPVSPETHEYRLVGTVDGTVLRYEPEAPPGAPKTIQAGQDVWIHSLEPFVVRSQDKRHPFFIAELMSSCAQIDPCGKRGCPGDPEFTTVVPTAQFLRNYLFFTDPTYPTTSLVVTRTRPEGGEFADVKLDCAGVISGWKPLTDRYEYTRLDLVTDGARQGGCDNGRHEMSSTQDFGVMIWGWGKDGILADGTTKSATGATSYAFPASRGLRPVNPVDIK
ncbi:hypothetical protein AKJ09_01782 [Labilithrix luteola]|uniref:IgGFc-binding protein N-terminal domain-containing protein n=1 Tax=Labilithrix luteola TaxID=1391654 RepID=A0A0K1PNL4_9BACT|nr:IgGFc-binding protein [Labilithrix luteola]AKU95118.1 hypothetical protein AKJ09_01782 [Labilithrix luteola]